MVYINKDGLLFSCRQPDPNDRPAFMDVLIPLQKPDFQLLKWSSEELVLYSEEARTLGATLEAGHQLHKDLQTKYLVANKKGKSFRMFRSLRKSKNKKNSKSPSKEGSSDESSNKQEQDSSPDGRDKEPLDDDGYVISNNDDIDGYELAAKEESVESTSLIDAHTDANSKQQEAAEDSKLADPELENGYAVPPDTAKESETAREEDEDGYDLATNAEED